MCNQHPGLGQQEGPDLTRKVGFGIIGAGHSAQNIARAIQACEQAQVANIYNHHLEGAEKLAREVEALKFGADLPDFFADRTVESVIICTPHFLHEPQALQAIRAGKHVLVEKPLGRTVEEGSRVVQAAKQAGKTLGVYYQRRTVPVFHKVKQLVRDGSLGTISQVNVQVQLWRDPPYYSESSWRGSKEKEGGGALLNQSIHWIDMLYYLFGPITRVVTSSKTLLQAVEVEDSLVSLLEFQNGIHGTFLASTVSFPGFPLRIEVFGSAGSIILDGFKAHICEEKGKPPKLVEDSSKFDAHHAMVTDFARAILEKRPPVVDGLEGLRSLEIVESMYESAARGYPVEVEYKNF